MIPKGIISFAEKLPGLSRNAAANYLDSGSRRAIKLANKVEANMPRGVNAIKYSREFADAHRSAAIAARQRKVAGRYVAGGALGLASVPRSPKPNESRTSYRGPMQTGRGIGRFS